MEAFGSVQSWVRVLLARGTSKIKKGGGHKVLTLVPLSRESAVLPKRFFHTFV